MKSFKPVKITFKTMKKGIIFQIMALMLLGGVEHAKARWRYNNYIQKALNDSGYGGVTNAGEILDKIQFRNPEGELSVFLNNLRYLSTESEAAQKVIESIPQDVLANIQFSLLTNDNIRNIINSRMGRGLNSGDKRFISQNLWIKPFGGKATQDDKDGKNGFSSNYFGLGIGYDAEYDIGQRAGVALFSTKSNKDVNNVSSSSDINGYTIVGYGNVPLSVRDNLFYQLSFGIQKTKSCRYVSLINKTANANYDTKTASANIKWVRNFELGKNTKIYPNISYTYTSTYIPSYTETGAGTLNLHVDSKTIREGLLGGGFNINHAINNISIISFSAYIAYDTIHDNNNVTANYEGATGLTFETNGIDNGRWKYNTGVNYKIQLKQNKSLEFSVNYNGMGNSFRNISGAIKYAWKF